MLRLVGDMKGGDGFDGEDEYARFRRRQRIHRIHLVGNAETHRQLNRQEAQFLQRRLARLSKLAERIGSAEAFNERRPVDGSHGLHEVFEDRPARRIEHLAQRLGGFARRPSEVVRPRLFDSAAYLLCNLDPAAKEFHWRQRCRTCPEGLTRHRL